MEQIEEHDETTKTPKGTSAVKDFTEELFLTINSSGVAAGDIAFGVANLVVRKVKPSVKKMLGK